MLKKRLDYDINPGDIKRHTHGERPLLPKCHSLDQINSRPSGLHKNGGAVCLMRKSEATNDIGLQAFARIGKTQRRSAAVLACGGEPTPERIRLGKYRGPYIKIFSPHG
jgi:hypothetical protein